jgi:DNA-binding winged helix-turn-helix (wHTH) protein/tetratricopeptide (TPR) repeat protein
MATSSHSQPVRFGSFEVDLRAGELRKEGSKVKLQEQPFQILAMLLERPGQLVTREELQTRLWASDTFVDFDHSLNKAINKLREALGDSAEKPRFVETLPRRGYRFLASVNGARDAVPKHGGAIDSIAVFPLLNPNPCPDLDYLAVGIPGSIIHGLSQIPGLRVIAWNSVARTANIEQDPLTIGRSVGARVILIGRIWQRGTKLRLHVDLLDALNGEELWGDQYDREITELFSVQDDISREVSRKLRLKMTGETEDRLTKRYTENIEAYQLYVRARSGCEKRTAEGFKRGIEYLSRAIQIDPNYALAHAELAQCISVPSYYGAVDPNIAYPKARDCALRALEIDSNLAEAHEVLATVSQNYDWDWPAAEKRYKRTIELNPNYAAGHYHYSYHLALQGRFEEGIREATEALSRDPMSGMLNSGLAFVLMLARKYDACIEQALTATEVDPEMTLCYWTLGVAYENKAMYRQALAAYEKCIGLGGTHGYVNSFIVRILAKSGEQSKALEGLRRIQEISKSAYVPHMAYVIAFDGLKENELAIASLQKACANRETNVVMIKTWPQFDNLRDDPRFQEVERRVGLRP